MGTTTACYFASIHQPASIILAEKAVKYGQRALVGKVNMNNTQVIDYCESLEDSLNETEKFIKGIQSINVSFF